MLLQNIFLSSSPNPSLRIRPSCVNHFVFSLLISCYLKTTWRSGITVGSDVGVYDQLPDIIQCVSSNFCILNIYKKSYCSNSQIATYSINASQPYQTDGYGIDGICYFILLHMNTPVYLNTWVMRVGGNSNYNKCKEKNYL